MNAFVRDAEGAVRLTLALLLAFGLHAALIFGIPVDDEVAARAPQPLRFEMVRLSPVERPEAPKARTTAPDPPEAGIETGAVPESVPPPQPAPPSSPAVEPSTAKLIPPPVATAKPASKPAAAAPPTKPPAAAPKPVSPPPAAPKPARPVPAAAKPAPAPPPRATKPTATAQPATKPPAPRPERAEPARKITETPGSPRLDSSALLGQIASLEAETQRRASAGVRSKRVNPSDTQSLEGFYIAAWVRKVEQIGEMNFPEIARRLNLNTGPVLDVAIRADGSLQEVRVVRSSGYPELDQAAQRIVRLGAPYAPFPSSLRQKYDVLQIARPWRFDAGGRVRAR
jgi:periplasmic protein TonB